MRRTFCGEVKGCRGASRPVTPVDSALPMRILVVVQDAIRVLAGVPILPKGQLGHCGIQILLHKFATYKIQVADPELTVADIRSTTAFLLCYLCNRPQYITCLVGLPAAATTAYM